MSNWTEISLQVYAWSLRNYGPTTKPWQMLAGVMEEVGEYLEHKDSGNREKMMDSLGDQAIYMTHLCFLTEVEFPGFKEGGYKDSVKGLVKDLAVGFRVMLKSSQGIRGYSLQPKSEKTKDALIQCLAGWRRWVNSEIKEMGMPDLLWITESVWEEVRKRDWKANPVDGKTG